MKGIIVILGVFCIMFALYVSHRLLYSEPFVSPNKTLCIYVVYEKNDQYRDNIRYFSKNAILPTVDYIFVVNGDLTVELPRGPNIRHMFRENKGYDFGAWGDALRFVNIEHYSYFMFINTSVRGPYKGQCGENWIQAFTSLITKDVKLAGTTINIFRLNPIKPHVQSMNFATDKEGLALLMKEGIFDPVPETYSFNDLIYNREIRMSTKILEHGWNITCIPKKYQNINYRVIKEDINPTSINGDFHFPNRYFGRSLTKDELIFYKTERFSPETM